MLKTLMAEVARPNGTAAVFLAGAIACELGIGLGNWKWGD